MTVEAVTVDEVRCFGLQVTQPAEGYRFSLDSLLLADFVSLSAGARICDLGTGCGVIPLILCRRFANASVTAIDSNASMVRLTAENAARNGLYDRIEPISADIVGLKSLFPVSSFDGVTANPPFRSPVNGRVSPRVGRDTARHESTAGIADFLAIAKYLVKPSGRISFVYHPDRLAEFIHCATELKLSLLRLRMIHSTRDAPAKIFLAELAKGRKGATTVIPPLIVYGADNDYSPEMKSILGHGL